MERIPQTIGYFAALFALGLATAVLGPTLPSLANHTQTGLSEISFLFTACSLGYMLGSIQGGRLYDRLPGHLVMAAALIIMAVMMALAPLMSLLWLLTVVLLILGLAEGAVDVGCNTLLVWVYRDKVGPYMNGMHFFFGVGAFLSPIIVAQAVLITGDIAWAYWVLALLILPGTAWLLRLPAPTAQAASKNGSSERAGYLTVFLIALFLCLYVGAEIGFGGWIFSYAVALKMSSETVAAYLTSAFWGALTLGRLLAIPIAARFRPRSILLVDLAGCLTSSGIILLWSNSTAAVWLGAVGLGLSMASIFPTTLSLAERRMKITGQVTGWFIVGVGAGSMSLPWLIGQLFESFGPRAMIFTILTDLVVAAAILGLLIFCSTRPAINNRILPSHGIS